MGHDTSLGTERLAHQGSPRNDQRCVCGGAGTHNDGGAQLVWEKGLTSQKF